MLISFVIPHYNLPRELLQRCIESIAAIGTDVHEYEIIIVDDGSKEPPRWVVELFCGINIKLIEAPHGGPGAARNAGMDAAHGDYIQFVDGDDTLIHHTFAHCMEILQDEQPDILMHGYRICNEKEEVAAENETALKQKTYTQAADYVAANNLSGSPCVYIFKSELANRYNIRFEAGVMHEDEDFNIKIFHYGNKLICSNRVAYNYCLRQESITSSTDNAHEKKRIEHLFALLERVTKFRSEQQKNCSEIQKIALDRKLAMLTVDTLLNIYYNGYTAKEIQSACNDKFAPLGLYPLPKASYSLKYKTFRALANNRIGIKILRKILPSQKPQKR